MGDIESSQTNTTVDTVASPEFSTTTTTEDRLRESGDLMNRIRLLQGDVGQLEADAEPHHHRNFEDHLDRRTTAAVARSLPELLAGLGGRGFAWQDIARLVGVSVPALRKWRNGENATGTHRKKVARLVAFNEIFEDEAHIDDIAAWMEVPLSVGAPITGLDIYVGDRLDLLYERACLRIGDEEALDRFEPDWRRRYSTNVEVFTAEDGELGLRLSPDSR